MKISPVKVLALYPAIMWVVEMFFTAEGRGEKMRTAENN